MAELFEYNLGIKRRYPSVLKGLEYGLFFYGGALGALEQLKKVALLDWEQALGAVEVI